jgi:hypothetical protein
MRVHIPLLVALCVMVLLAVLLFPVDERLATEPADNMLLMYLYQGNVTQLRITAFMDGTVLYESKADAREVQLSQEELEALKRFIAEKQYTKRKSAVVHEWFSNEIIGYFVVEDGRVVAVKSADIPVNLVKKYTDTYS